MSIPEGPPGSAQPDDGGGPAFAPLVDPSGASGSTFSMAQVPPPATGDYGAPAAPGGQPPGAGYGPAAGGPAVGGPGPGYGPGVGAVPGGYGPPVGAPVGGYGPGVGAAPGGYGPGTGAPPPVAGSGPVLVQVGDIAVTQTEVVLPNGRFPLRGTTWSLNPQVNIQRKIPTWAIVCAIVGFLFVCVLSLFFLLAKENTAQGFVQITVQGAGFTHTAQTGVVSEAQVRDIENRVNYIRNLVAQLG
ncbi:MAG TPA: hypothetical protein VME46_25520 [Acidimicrobiales bacterium]|nr:hypothetical protein [Acidimicrobiales bacterium]